MLHKFRPKRQRLRVNDTVAMLAFGSGEEMKTQISGGSVQCAVAEERRGSVPFISHPMLPHPTVFDVIPKLHPFQIKI